MNDTLVYSLAETARVLGISRTTVYRLLLDSTFPAFKVGNRTLVSKAGLAEWVERKTAGKECDNA